MPNTSHIQEIRILALTYVEQHMLNNSTSLLARLLSTGQVFSDNVTFHYKSEERKQLYALKGKKMQASQLLIKITLKQQHCTFSHALPKHEILLVLKLSF